VLLKAGDDPDLAEAAFEVFFAERNRVQLFDDALPALEWLASRYPVVAVSNGNADVHRVGLGQHFKGAISAREFGVGKPDARIFHAAASLAGVRHSEVLHVGDDAQLDVLGALVAGLQVAWINREGHGWEHEPMRPHTTVRDLLSLCMQLA
jgi:HAD superfamily hydrolase (TIGR01549 family)